MGTYLPSVVPISVGDLDSHLIHGPTHVRQSPKRHLGRFSRYLHT